MKNAFPRATWIPLLVATLCFAVSLPLILGSAREKARQIATLTSLKVIGAEIMLYVKSHDGMLPPLGNVTEMMAALPLVRPAMAESSGWRIPFATNASLSGKSADVPAETVLVYEQKPVWYDGKMRGVVFADGHAKLVTEENWPELREKSKIFELPEPSVARWWQLGKAGPREPVNEYLLGLILAGMALFWLTVSAVLRARLSAKPVAEFVVALLTYVTLALVLGSIAVSFIPRIA